MTSQSQNAKGAELGNIRNAAPTGKNSLAVDPPQLEIAFHQAPFYASFHFHKDPEASPELAKSEPSLKEAGLAFDKAETQVWAIPGPEKPPVHQKPH